MKTTLPPLPCAALSVLISMLFLLPAAPAAPLATNDTCTSAIEVPGSGPFPYWTPVMNVTNATTVGDPVVSLDCATNMTRSVWFKFRPTTAGLYGFSFGTDTLSTIQDTVMAIYTSAGDCAGPFVVYDCINDPGPLQAAITTNLSANTTYWIVGWVAEAVELTPASSDLQLRVTQPVPPASDLCSGATVIPPAGPFPHFTATNDITLAGVLGDPGDRSCATNVFVRSVWYRFTPSTSGIYSFATFGNPGSTVFETARVLYRSSAECNGTLTVVRCVTNNAVLTSNLVANTTYFLLVWDKSPELIPGETSLQLRVGLLVPPTVSTLAHSNLISTGVTFRAQINQNGAVGRYWFEYGPSTNPYSAITPAFVLGAGITNTFVTVTVNGLTAGTLYHFRAIATNSLGKTFGADQTCQWSATQPTLAPPTHEPNGDFRFHFDANPGQRYVVQATTNLTHWVDLGSATEPTPGTFQYLEAASARKPHQFYRLRLP